MPDFQDLEGHIVKAKWSEVPHGATWCHIRTKLQCFDDLW